MSQSIGTSQSDLAKQLAPPKKKGLGGPITLAIICGILSFAFGAPLLDALSGQPGGELVNVPLYSIVFVIFTVLTIGAILLVPQALSYNNHTYPSEFAEWDKKYFCLRCSNVFEPNGASQARNALNGSHPASEDAKRKKVQIALGWVVLAAIALLSVLVINSQKPSTTASAPAAPHNFVAAAVKPSFDCSKATARADRLVCSDANLAALDVQLAALYKSAREVSEDPSVIAADQRQ